MQRDVARSISEIRAGLRRVGFERRVTVFFVVAEDHVSILRIFYAGRDWQAYLDELSG
jgi:toxin ParE1/3/4